MEKVLVIRFSALGDLTMALPAIDHLYSQGNEVHLLTKEAFVPLIAAYNTKIILHTISNHASLAELRGVVRSLRKSNFDRVYDLHRNIRSRLTTFLLRRPSQTISKFRFKEFCLFLLRRRLFLFFFSPIDRARAALELVGAKEFGHPGLLHTQALKQPELLERWSKRSKYICIAVESAWTEKEWAVSRFIEVAKHVEKLGYGIVWIGLRAVPAQAKFEGSLDLTATLGLKEVISVLQGAALLVCNDSGLMHIAESAGKPVVAVFGPTSRELGFAPRSPRSRIVEAQLWCRPCSKTGRRCIRPVSRWKCLSDVTVDSVVNVVKQVLG